MHYLCIDFMKVLLTTYLPLTGFGVLKGLKLIVPTQEQQQFTLAELEKLIIDADFLVPTFDYPVPSTLLDKAKHLKLIANFGSGYNNLPISYCRQRGIMVTNTPAPVIEPTAEHAWALLHALAHRVAELDRRLRMPQRDGIRFGVMQNLGTQLYGKTLGIIGMGNIGQALARRACAGGMKIIYHNRKQLPADIEIKYAARYVSFQELISTADIVSLNLPYTQEVHHLINKEVFSQMKNTVLLLNTARGAHVDEQALVDALRNKQISGAALDVYEHEPDINDALLQFNNVVLSPHIGTGTWEGRVEMGKCVSQNIMNYINNNINMLNSVL